MVIAQTPVQTFEPFHHLLIISISLAIATHFFTLNTVVLFPCISFGWNACKTPNTHYHGTLSRYQHARRYSGVTRRHSSKEFFDQFFSDFAIFPLTHLCVTPLRITAAKNAVTRQGQRHNCMRTAPPLTKRISNSCLTKTTPFRRLWNNPIFDPFLLQRQHSKQPVFSSSPALFKVPDADSLRREPLSSPHPLKSVSHLSRRDSRGCSQ